MLIVFQLLLNEEYAKHKFCHYVLIYKKVHITWIIVPFLINEHFAEFLKVDLKIYIEKYIGMFVQIREFQFSLFIAFFKKKLKNPLSHFKII